MSTRPRPLLPAFALTAIAVSLAVVVPAFSPVEELPESAAAATPEHPEPKPPSEPRPRPAPKPTLGERAATIALEAVGVPYRWGGTSPLSGFDCSGLVYWAYGRLGIDVPHSSYALYSTGRSVSRAHLKPGDVLFFSGLGHVGLYLGHGRMVHAPQSGRSVEVARLAGSSYGGRLVGARRLVSA